MIVVYPQPASHNLSSIWLEHDVDDDYDSLSGVAPAWQLRAIRKMGSKLGTRTLYRRFWYNVTEQRAGASHCLAGGRARLALEGVLRHEVWGVMIERETLEAADSAALITFVIFASKTCVVVVVVVVIVVASIALIEDQVSPMTSV